MKLFGRLAQFLRDKNALRGYTCDACGKEVFAYPHERLCKDCEQSLVLNAKTTCPKCGRPTPAQGVCLACKIRPPAFTRGMSVFVYKDKTATLVNLIKNGNRRLAYYLGERMTEVFLQKAPKRESWLILPVPTTPRKLCDRGYNQAEAIAQVVWKKLNEAGVTAELDGDALRCRDERVSQKDLSFKDRVKNAQGAYTVHKRKLCRDRTILLVDDVMTTGATGGACAQVLRAAGAKEVYFLTAAALPEKKD